MGELSKQRAGSAWHLAMPVATSLARVQARRGKKVNTINYHLQRISRMIRR